MGKARIEGFTAAIDFLPLRPLPDSDRSVLCVWRGARGKRVVWPGWYDKSDDRWRDSTAALAPDPILWAEIPSGYPAP